MDLRIGSDYDACAMFLRPQGVDILYTCDKDAFTDPHLRLQGSICDKSVVSSFFTGVGEVYTDNKDHFARAMLDACLMRVFAFSTAFYDYTDTAIMHLKRNFSNPTVAHRKRDMPRSKSRFQMPAKNGKKCTVHLTFLRNRVHVRTGTEQASLSILCNLISFFIQKYKNFGFLYTFVKVLSVLGTNQYTSR